MSYKKTLVRLLDRRGGRALLGKIGTHVVRRSGTSDVKIIYIDDLWTRRVGLHFFPDSPNFGYRTNEDFSSWKTQMERYIRDAHDYWLRYDQPTEGAVIVDVGAGRGEDTVAFANAVGETGRVIAIEAHPLSFAILNSFCRLNRLENVTALNLALMDKPGATRMRDCGSSGSSWQANVVESENGSSTIEVRAATLAQVCEQERLENIAFLKMNIEGAERYALPGMLSVMPRIKQICVACHDFRSEQGHGEQFRTHTFVERFLVENGFNIASRPDDPRDYVRDHVFGLRPT